MKLAMITGIPKSALQAPRTQSFMCPHSQKGWFTLASCTTRCKRFPCRYMGPDHINSLIGAGVLMWEFTGLKRDKRGVVPLGLWVFELENGEMQYAPRGFDPDKATAAQLTGVVRVLYVGKVLVPQTRLVATKEVKELMGKAKDSEAEPPGEGKVGKPTGAKRQPSPRTTKPPQRKK